LPCGVANGWRRNLKTLFWHASVVELRQVWTEAGAGFAMNDEHKRQRILDSVREKIDKHGFTVISTYDADTEVPFSYSVGFAQNHRAELFMELFEPQLCQMIMTQIHTFVSRERDLQPCVVTGLMKNNLPIALVPLTHTYASRMDISQTIYGTGFDALQVVLPDPQGLFPWEDGFDTEAMPGARVLRKDADSPEFSAFAATLPKVNTLH
jgi:hypothetical protein